MTQKHSGSCLCDKVKYEIEGDFDCFYLCHCTFCQKDTGSAHGANLFSSTAKLKWMAGKETVNTFNLPSTRHTKSFCRDCGSALPSEQMNGQLLVVPAGSLNTATPLAPTAHIFCASRATWDKQLESVKTFETFPS